MTNPLDNIARWKPPVEGKYIASSLAKNKIKVKQKAAKAQAKRPREHVGATLRNQVITEASDACEKCGAKADPEAGVSLHVDHIHPVKLGGKTVRGNLQCLCSTCNLGKGARLQPRSKPREKKPGCVQEVIPNTRVLEQLAAIVGKKSKVNKETGEVVG